MTPHVVGRLSALVLLGLVGCGTTVPLSSRATTADLAGIPGGTDSGVTPSGTGTGTGDGRGGAGQNPGLATGQASVAGAPDATGASGGVGRTVAGTMPAPGATFGVTDTAIYVGVPYSSNGDAFIAALGINATTGDQKAEAQIVINEINGRGGIYGRKLVPIFYGVEATGDPSTIRQAECAAFTQDAHAFASLVDIGADGNESLIQCITRAGGVIVNQNLSLIDEEIYRRYPTYLSPGDLRLDRAARLRALALHKAGYFTPWDPELQRPGVAPAKVGVITADALPFVRTLNRVLLPELKAHGHAVDPRNVVLVDVSSESSGLADIQSAVLRFRQAGVTHVIILDAGGGGTLFFAEAAQAQHYYPRYGLDSYNGAQLWLNTGALPASVFTGAIGVGWVPLLDLPGDKNPLNGPNSNATRRRCVALQRAHGQQLPDVNAERHAVALCDMFWMLEAALKAGGPNISRESFLRGATALGTSYVDGQTFATRLADDTHDGVAKARPFAMDSSCGCFLYTGPLAQVP